MNSFKDQKFTLRKKAPLFSPFLSFVVKILMCSNPAGGMNISRGTSGFMRTVSRSSHLLSDVSICLVKGCSSGGKPHINHSNR